MKKLFVVFLLVLNVVATNNTTIVPGASQVKIYLGNYPYSQILTMPYLSLRLASDINRLFYSDVAGVKRKIMVDATGSTNTPTNRIFYSDANGAATSNAGLLFDGTNFTAPNLTTAGLVDGVDVSAFKTSYDGHNHGTGTTNALTKFTNGATGETGDSRISDDGDLVTVTGPLSTTGNIAVSKNAPAFTEYNYTGAIGGTKVSVGMLGNPEANLAFNMDYTVPEHHYYDPTSAAMWLALNDHAWGMQFASPGYSNSPGQDMWTGQGARYLMIQDTGGHLSVNSSLSEFWEGVPHNAMVTIKRDGTLGHPSIGGITDFVIEGSTTKGTSAPVYANVYNAGLVSLAAGGGNVGIGTITANSLLEINRDGLLQLKMKKGLLDVVNLASGSSESGAGSEKGILQLFDSTIEKVRVSTYSDSWLKGGNVGIGKTPTAPLDVAGLALADSVRSATLNTGNGANELYAMNQNVQTTDSINGLVFNSTRLRADNVISNHTYTNIVSTRGYANLTFGSGAYTPLISPTGYASFGQTNSSFTPACPLDVKGLARIDSATIPIITGSIIIRDTLTLGTSTPMTDRFYVDTSFTAVLTMFSPDQTFDVFCTKVGKMLSITIGKVGGMSMVTDSSATSSWPIQLPSFLWPTRVIGAVGATGVGSMYQDGNSGAVVPICAQIGTDGVFKTGPIGSHLTWTGGGNRVCGFSGTDYITFNFQM